MDIEFYNPINPADIFNQISLLYKDRPSEVYIHKSIEYILQNMFNNSSITVDHFRKYLLPFVRVVFILDNSSSMEECTLKPETGSHIFKFNLIPENVAGASFTVKRKHELVFNFLAMTYAFMKANPLGAFDVHFLNAIEGKRVFTDISLQNSSKLFDIVSLFTHRFNGDTPLCNTVIAAIQQLEMYAQLDFHFVIISDGEPCSLFSTGKPKYIFLESQQTFLTIVKEYFAEKEPESFLEWLSSFIFSAKKDEKPVFTMNLVICSDCASPKFNRFLKEVDAASSRVDVSDDFKTEMTQLRKSINLLKNDKTLQMTFPELFNLVETINIEELLTGNNELTLYVYKLLIGSLNYEFEALDEFCN